MREDKSVADLCSKFELRPYQINKCVRGLLAHPADAFDGIAEAARATEAAEPVDVASLHDRQNWPADTAECFLKDALSKAGLLSEAIESTMTFNFPSCARSSCWA